MKLYTGVWARGKPIVMLTSLTSAGMEWRTGSSRDSLQRTTAVSLNEEGVLDSSPPADSSLFLIHCGK